jgi:hypothetical protein
MIRFVDDETSAGGSFVRPLALRCDVLGFSLSGGEASRAVVRGARAGMQGIGGLLRVAQLPRVAQPA